MKVRKRKALSETTLQMIELYKSGKSLQELADSFGCTWQNVQNRLKTAGIELRTPQQNGLRNRKVFDAKILRELYLNKKMSCQQIAQILQTSDTTVAKNLKRLGVAMRTRDEASFLTRTKTQELGKERLEYLYRNLGQTQNEIARAYGIAQSRVAALLAKYGLNIGRGVRRRTHQSLRDKSQQ